MFGVQTKLKMYGYLKQQTILISRKLNCKHLKDKTETEAAVEGAIVVYADPLQNTTPTTMTVNVKRCLGLY